jgi:hypothetical protein
MGSWVEECWVMEDSGKFLGERDWNSGVVNQNGFKTNHSAASQQALSSGFFILGGTIKKTNEKTHRRMHAAGIREV